MYLANFNKFEKLIDGWEKMFRKFYALVCTRCYGYYLPFTFCAPVADLFNHDHNNDNGLIIFNKELHTDPLKSKTYFKSNKYLNNVQLMYDNDDEAD